MIHPKLNQEPSKLLSNTNSPPAQTFHRPLKSGLVASRYQWMISQPIGLLLPRAHPSLNIINNPDCTPKVMTCSENSNQYSLTVQFDKRDITRFVDIIGPSASRLVQRLDVQNEAWQSGGYHWCPKTPSKTWLRLS